MSVGSWWLIEKPVLSRRTLLYALESGVIARFTPRSMPIGE